MTLGNTLAIKGCLSYSFMTFTQTFPHIRQVRAYRSQSSLHGYRLKIKESSKAVVEMPGPKNGGATHHVPNINSDRELVALRKRIKSYRKNCNNRTACYVVQNSLLWKKGRQTLQKKKKKSCSAPPRDMQKGKNIRPYQRRQVQRHSTLFDYRYYSSYRRPGPRSDASLALTA